MEDSAYGPINVTIRAQENTLLTRGHFDRMLAASSFEEAVNVLRETPYRNDVDRIKEDRDYDTMFMNKLNETFEELFASTPNKGLVEIASLRYSYHNLKVLFKEEITEQDFSDLYIPIGRYDISELRKAVRTGQSDVLTNEYLESVAEVQADLDDYQNAESIDIILDRRYFTHLRNLAESLGEDEILDLVIKKIDYYNISTLVRALRQGRTKNFLTAILSSAGSISKDDLLSQVGTSSDEVARFLIESDYQPIIEASIDRDTNKLSPVQIDFETDNAYMRNMQDAKLKAFGPLPTLAYIFARETEITNIRLVLSGKENGVDAEHIRERMRLNYGS